MNDIKEFIESGKAILGIEFGSTRIKAVLIDDKHNPIAMGAHNWENRLLNGIWTYTVEDIWEGLADCYADLLKDVDRQYGTVITSLAALGFSGMMHGYMPFNQSGDLLVPFRTWRNTITGEAAKELSATIDFNVPQRWSIAHLYQAILNREEHINDIDFFTTLAGYVHWKLSGEKVLGIGEASGMFPIDVALGDYDQKRLDIVDRLMYERGVELRLRDILPKVLRAGENAGVLSEEGARLLDRSGNLRAGVLLAPPEGDAGTGMTATNSVSVRTGNVSAGTSVFAMVVLEKPLSNVHEELDIVTTPYGDDVAMVHCNNCTSDINAWVGLFKDFCDTFGIDMNMDRLYETLFKIALKGDKDCGGLLSYNFLSGEPVCGLTEGRPMFVRQPDAKMNLANFMRTHIYSSLAALKIGCDILFKEEKVEVDKLYGHGGLFKTEGVGQNILAAAMNAPVSVMKTAGEGGPWGMAVLAAYMTYHSEGETLSEYLNNKVFAGEEGNSVLPSQEDVDGFNTFLDNYVQLLPAESKAVEVSLR